MDTRPRRALIIAGGIIVVLVIVGTGLLITRPWETIAGPSSPTASSDPDVPEPTSSPTPIASASGTPATPKPAPRSTGQPIPEELRSVALSQPVAAPGDVKVSLVLIESVDAIGSAPGETSGPAIRVTVRIENDSKAALPGSYVAVNAYTGQDRAPAATIMHPGGDPFSGEIEPGKRAEGVYLFTLPESDRADVLIGVDYQAGKPTVTFRGSLG